MSPRIWIPAAVSAATVPLTLGALLWLSRILSPKDAKRRSRYLRHRPIGDLASRRGALGPDGDEPTDAEIEEYANWLGMTAPEDDDLRWIAREGLKAPLPEHWKPCKTSDGEIYYFNFSSGESVWDHPCDDYYKNMYKEEKDKLAKKKTADAEKAARSAMEHGVRKVDVQVKGPGSGRETAIRSLQNAGIEVTGIKDVTPIPHNGCRPKKRRRV